LSDIEALVDRMDDPMLMSFQLTVDLKPKTTLPAAEREALLLETFHAVAGRFRPEDEALWAYDVRGGTDDVGRAPKPFHRRFPHPNEELVYGRRGGWMQSTVYLKRTNEGVEIAEEERAVRMELTLVRGGVMEVGLDRLSGFRNLGYRPMFTKHFRVIAEPRVRAIRTRDEKTLARMNRRMWRAWATAGVGKFGTSQSFRPDTLLTSVSRIAARESQQLPMTNHVLVRDQDCWRQWGAVFVHWYNLEHKHSGIRYLSPQQRHCGEDHAILAARHALYTQTKERNPARWSGNTRNWQPIGAVTLNPERDSVISEHVAQKLIQPLAA
jgi:hypothetical protein